MKYFHLCFFFLLFCFSSCIDESITKNDLPVSGNPTNRMDGSSSSMGEVLIELDGKILDMDSIGFFHNLLLTYVSEHSDGFVYLNDNLLYGHVDSLFFMALSNISLSYPDVYNYISEPNLGRDPSPWELRLAQMGYGEAPTDSLKAQFDSALDSLYSYHMLTLPEKMILMDYVDDLCNGTPIDYKSILSQIDTVSNKAYDGVCSRSILSVGFHSACWWKEFYIENVDPEPTTQSFIGHAMADLIGGACGWGWHCYDNWEDHYMSDFGLNGLRAAGRQAVNTSAASFTRYF